MIEIENLCKDYGGKPVVDNLSCALPEGKVIAFIGSNGAGKSTVLSIISRLLSPSSGIVRIDGVEITRWNTRELAKKMAVLTQTTTITPRLTVRELVRFGRFPHSQGRLTQQDHEIVDKAMQFTGIMDFADRFLDELSGGQRQMAYIAMVIAQDTKYVLLDEPLNNLDMGRSAQIMRLLRALTEKQGKTVIIVIHDINFVSFHADWIMALNHGKLAGFGPVEDIINPEALKRIYNLDIAVEDYNGKKLCVYY